MLDPVNVPGLTMDTHQEEMIALPLYGDLSDFPKDEDSSSFPRLVSFWCLGYSLPRHLEPKATIQGQLPYSPKYLR